MTSSNEFFLENILIKWITLCSMPSSLCLLGQPDTCPTIELCDLWEGISSLCALVSSPVSHLDNRSISMAVRRVPGIC